MVKSKAVWYHTAKTCWGEHWLGAKLRLIWNTHWTISLSIVTIRVFIQASRKSVLVSIWSPIKCRHGSVRKWWFALSPATEFSFTGHHQRTNFRGWQVWMRRDDDGWLRWRQNSLGPLSLPINRWEKDKYLGRLNLLHQSGQLWPTFWLTFIKTKCCLEAILGRQM